MITVMKNNEIKTNKISGAVGESFDSEKFRDFAERLEVLVNDRDIFKVIKDGSTTVVGTIGREESGLDVDVVVKCFKNGGLLKTFGRRFLGSKAKSLFEKSSKLFDLGLNVAEPVCFIDLFGPIESCFISIDLGGCKNFATISEELVDNNPSSLAQSIAGEMLRWHSKFITHGDMKWSNIMVIVGDSADDNMKSYFIDLDQAEFGKSVNVSGVMDDLTRFYRYGIERGREGWVHNVFLPIYMESALEPVRYGLNIETIAIRAMGEHELKNK